MKLKLEELSVRQKLGMVFCARRFGEEDIAFTIKMIKELRQEFYFGEDSPLVCNENGGVTKPDVFRRRYHRLLEGAGIKSKGLHSLRHTFATNLVNGVKQPDGTIKSLTVKQVADLLGHSTTQVTEMYYVKKDTSMLNGITNDFCL